MHEHTAPATLALYSHVLSLKLLPRIGWLQRGVAHPESIADHSFGVAVLALLVGDQTPGIDRGKLLAIALIHDLAEATLGDLPAPAQRFFGAPTKHAAERAALRELVADLPVPAHYTDLWDEYANGSSPEARLIKALDRVEMLAQALAYQHAGNRNLDAFWAIEPGESSAEFPLVAAMLAQLVEQHASS